MQYLSILPLAIIVSVILIGGPLTLVAGLRIFNHWYGNLRARPVRSNAKPEDNAALALLVTWDPEARPYKVSRIRFEFSELIPGGRSTACAFTFEDKSAKKRSFVLPMKLSAEALTMLTDARDERTLKRSQVSIEIESVDGRTVRRKLNKKEFMKALESAPLDPASIEVDAVPATTPDTWGVLTRVFPWRKVAEVAVEKKSAGAAKSAGGSAAAQIYDFIITKVWIEPGCIVCDACENEAPEVFHVLADTCIVRENAPLTDTASIIAGAEGCPVDVIKYEKAPKPA
jgi:ferredoxin